jgi:hypothetical protein
VSEEFLANEGAKWANDFKGLKSGTQQFTNVWKEIAKTLNKEFSQAQHDFIKRIYFTHNVELTKNVTGVDISKDR